VTYRGGEAKTDAKDARVIADQSRMRGDDLPVLHPDDELITELRMFDHPSRGSGRRPHPHDQPAAPAAHRGVSRPGTGCPAVLRPRLGGAAGALPGARKPFAKAVFRG
jgi:Transposase